MKQYRLIDLFWITLVVLVYCLGRVHQRVETIQVRLEAIQTRQALDIVVDENKTLVRELERLRKLIPVIDIIE